MRAMAIFPLLAVKNQVDVFSGYQRVSSDLLMKTSHPLLEYEKTGFDSFFGTELFSYLF